jgi:hypothetical protein
MNHSQAITHLRSLAGICDSTTYAPLDVHPGTEAPQFRGERGYHTTPSGNTIVHHPHAYRWRTVYHCSTQQLCVGRDWLRAQALGEPSATRCAALQILSELPDAKVKVAE